MTLSPTLLLPFLALLAQGDGHATEVYRWTDAAGQVHFGDRSSAPTSSQRLDVKPPVAPAAPATASAPKTSGPEAARAARPEVPVLKPLPGSGAGRSVDASRVPAGCQDLIGQIAQVRAGTPWTELSQQFDQRCPGLAYECREYLATPEKNRCRWIQRDGSSVLLTHRFP